VPQATGGVVYLHCRSIYSSYSLYVCPKTTRVHWPTSNRFAPEVVEARRVLLERCLQDTLAAPQPLSSAEALTAFLDPAHDPAAPAAAEGRVSVWGSSVGVLAPPRLAG
jgi:hypothetical protein